MAALYFILAVFGAIFGSFAGAWSYRLPRRLKITTGRSFCPKCKTDIFWYDNIPILSFINLRGRCRNCKKQITFREPIIEIATALIFFLIFYFSQSCSVMGLGSILCEFNEALGIYSLPYFLTISLLLIVVFVIDLEHKIIPDELSFGLYILAIFAAIAANDDLFLRLFVSTLAALFLLALHLVTKGKGMGLGDVKLVLFAPLILGWENTLVWFMLSFIVGALTGVLFIVAGKASFGKQIPFGPFLVISFFLTIFFSDILKSVFLL